MLQLNAVAHHGRASSSLPFVAAVTDGNHFIKSNMKSTLVLELLQQHNKKTTG